MLVVVSSVRGSPGVSSWALLLAAAWPVEYGAERIVVEADIDGGVVGARYGVGVEPGVVSMIAALRRSTDTTFALADHARLLAPSVWVVPGPETAEQARRVWTGTSGAVARSLADDSGVWFADVGRIGEGDPTIEFADAAAMTIVMTRGATADLVQIPSRVQWLTRRIDGPVAVVVVGRTEHRPDELALFFGSDFVWSVGETDDLPALAAAVVSGGRARRSWLWRSAVDLASRVAEAATAVGSAPSVAALKRGVS